jgi:predicted SprT family Zn-dependent metalloprotease
MAGIREARTTWVAYRGGIYICLAGPLRSFGWAQSGMWIIIDERSKEAVVRHTPWDNPSLLSGLRGIASEFHLDAPPADHKNLHNHPWGIWYKTKSLHPLAGKAVSMAWEWVAKGGNIPTGTGFYVELAPGEVRKQNGVTYEGYTNRVLKVHSFDVLSRLVDQAQKLCADSWGWKAQDMRVMLHGSGNAMGMAYSPGKGIHRISLHSKLLKEYDEMSIFRVILHELCHHYRNERFPLSLRSHDEVFCRELAKVDPVVAQDTEKCTFFKDEEWEGSVVVQAKKEKAAALSKPSTYDPAQGFLQVRVLKSGQLRLDWLPYDGGFTRKAIPVSDHHMRELFEPMHRRQKQSIKVTGADVRSSRFLQKALLDARKHLQSNLDDNAWLLLHGMAIIFNKPQYAEYAG